LPIIKNITNYADNGVAAALVTSAKP
jgi:hypothetical protein